MLNRKWIMAAAAVICLIPAGVSPAYAEDGGMKETGTITIHLTDIGTSFEGAVMSVRKVGSVDLEGEPIYEIDPALSETGVDLAEVTQGTAEEQHEAALLIAEAAEKAFLAVYEKEADGAGTVVFSGLEAGVYLVEEEDPGSYGTMDPFLICIPFSTDGRTYEYDVLTQPKAEPVHAPTPVPTPTPEPSPSTGVWNSPAPYLAAAAVCGGLLVILLLKRYSRSEIR